MEQRTMKHVTLGDTVRHVPDVQQLGTPALLTLGQTYKVIAVSVSSIKVCNDGLAEAWYVRSRFEMVDSSPHYPNPPHVHAELIKAWADGAIIQVFHACPGCWVDLAETPRWYVKEEYRIKPCNPNSEKIEELEKQVQQLADQLAELKKEV